MLARLEDYTGSLISISDCDDRYATVRIWGGECELARVVILAITLVSTPF